MRSARSFGRWCNDRRKSRRLICRSAAHHHRRRRLSHPGASMTRSSPDIGQALSPCPFCGGRANVYVNEVDFVTKWSVGCGDCNCNMDVCEDTPADAAVEWNTRDQAATSPKPSAENTDLLNCVAILLASFRNFEEAIGEKYDDEGGDIAGIEREFNDGTLGVAQAAPDSKLMLFLSIIESAGGETSGNDEKWNWINYFCDDAEPLDTFNQASKRRLTRVTHDSYTDDSRVYLTDAGRAFLAGGVALPSTYQAGSK